MTTSHLWTLREKEMRLLSDIDSAQQTKATVEKQIRCSGVSRKEMERLRKRDAEELLRMSEELMTIQEEIAAAEADREEMHARWERAEAEKAQAEAAKAQSEAEKAKAQEERAQSEAEKAHVKAAYVQVVEERNMARLDRIVAEQQVKEAVEAAAKAAATFEELSAKAAAALKTCKSNEETLLSTRAAMDKEWAAMKHQQKCHEAMVERNLTLMRRGEEVRAALEAKVRASEELIALLNQRLEGIEQREKAEAERKVWKERQGYSGSRGVPRG